MVTGRIWPGLALLAALGACSSSSLDSGVSKKAAAAPEPSREAGDKDPGPGDNQPPSAETGATDASAGGRPSSSPRTTPMSGAGAAGAANSGDVPGRAYPGAGFVVHEWGTDTIVVGSDGSLQRGLHHEEEDLPAFAYDRIKAGAALGTTPSRSVTIKMETPVTYFYSEIPLEVKASVSFPQGVLTQWYPGVASFLPPVAAAGAIGPDAPLSLADPVLDLEFPFVGEMCREKSTTLAGGVLDWGSLSVLPRGADVEASLPVAPLEKFSWSYARAVDSNPLVTSSGEHERFLFYRGLGNFELPVTVTAEAGGHLALRNQYSEAIGSVFLLNVDEQRGAFTAHTEGIAAAATLRDTAPSLEGAQPLDEYAEALAQAVVTTLDASGLYHDEATAMVNTWKRQWFRTRGTRLLYVIPQTWTDRSIPLTITPEPAELLRVMLIRVEVITPEQEASDVQAVAALGTQPLEARAHFDALGRFAEPRLRRALSLSPSASGDAYLSEIVRAGGAVVRD